MFAPLLVCLALGADPQEYTDDQPTAEEQQQDRKVELEQKHAEYLQRRQVAEDLRKLLWNRLRYQRAKMDGQARRARSMHRSYENRAADNVARLQGAAINYAYGTMFGRR